MIFTTPIHATLRLTQSFKINLILRHTYTKPCTYCSNHCKLQSAAFLLPEKLDFSVYAILFHCMKSALIVTDYVSNFNITAV